MGAAVALLMIDQASKFHKELLREIDTDIVENEDVSEKCKLSQYW